VRSVTFAGVVFVAGCSLLVPLDASSGGGDEPPDATADGASSSSSGDATTSSSGGSSGAPGDATSEGAAGPTLKCPPAALLCDDFERNDIAGANGWNVSGLAISTQLAHSPTRSVAIFDPTNDYRAMQRVFETPPLYLKVSFRLHAGASPPGFVELLKIPFGPAYQWDTATLGLDLNGLHASMQRYDGQTGPAVSNTTVAAAPAGIYGDGFRLVVWQIDFRNTEKHVAVYVDGAGPADFTLAGHSPSVGPAVFAIGTLYRNSDGQVVDTYIDDVVVEAL
jgi:hypothetical protein